MTIALHTFELLLQLLLMVPGWTSAPGPSWADPEVYAAEQRRLVMTCASVIPLHLGGIALANVVIQAGHALAERRSPTLVAAALAIAVLLPPASLVLGIISTAGGAPALGVLVWPFLIIGGWLAAAGAGTAIAVQREQFVGSTLDLDTPLL